MILLTGGTGFIGSYILYYLLREGYGVRAIRRETSSISQTRFIFSELLRREGRHETPEALLAGVEWVEASLLDLHAMQYALEGVREVIHAAAVVSFNRKERRETIRINAQGTALLVNLLVEKGIEKFGYVSSVAAIGRKSGNTADETMWPDIHHFAHAYAESKYRAEMEVWRGWGEGLPVVVINPALVLGWGDFSKGSIKMFNTIAKGLPFYPPGGNGFVDARDVAKTLLKLMKRPEAVGQRYIAVSENWSYHNLFAAIAKGVGAKPPSIATNKFLSYSAWVAGELKAMLTGGEAFVTRSMVETALNSYYYNGDKLKSLLRHEFIPLEQTIRESAEAYKTWKTRYASSLK